MKNPKNKKESMELVRVKGLLRWRKIHRLYKAAFPKYERKPFCLIKLMHGRGNADVWIINSSGEFSGFAVTMNAGDLVLLDYFAVSPEKRGKGLGSEALGKLQAIYRDRRMFLEIESVYAEADNISERRRRKQFYLKNGMTEMKVMADVFGTEMELLGFGCSVNFKEYQSVYLTNYGKWAAENLKEMNYPD